MSNLNDVRPKITHITLSDGVEREIKFTLNAMAEMEDRYGSVEAAFKALENNSIKAVRFILWAGLMHDGISEQEVGNLIDITCMEEIMQQVSGALGNDMETGEVPNEPVLATIPAE